MTPYWGYDRKLINENTSLGFKWLMNLTNKFCLMLVYMNSLLSWALEELTQISMKVDILNPPQNLSRQWKIIFLLRDY